MFKIFVTVDKHQRFKSFISQTTSIRLEHSSSSAEKSFASNFKIADYFFNLRVTMILADAFGSSASQYSIALLSI